MVGFQTPLLIGDNLSRHERHENERNLFGASVRRREFQDCDTIGLLLLYVNAERVEKNSGTENGTVPTWNGRVQR